MSLKDREPSSPAEWADYYRRDLKTLRGNREQLQSRLDNVRRTIAQWEAVVAMDRCPKGYRQMTVALDGVPTDHDYWWLHRQRPALNGELNDLRDVQKKLERELSRLG